MRFINYVCAAAIAVAAVGASSAALAQRNRDNNSPAVVVDVERVAAESVLGRDMTTKLQAVATAIQHDAQALQPEGQSIEQERQRLATTLRTLTPEQLRANSQVVALAQRTQQFQQRGQALEGDMRCSQLLAINDFNRQMNPVIQTIAQQRGASVVVNASSSIWTASNADITAAVIQQLDATARTSSAARHAVTECQQQAAPAAAPGQ